MTERVLVLAAHPDDESLGVGATLAKHAKAGDAISIVAMADGVASRGLGTQAAQARRLQYRRACKILGTEDVWIHQYADNEMDNLPLLTIVKHLEIHLDRFKPTIVYTHWRTDLNVDHRVMHDAANVACRPAPGCTVKKLYYFEVPCSTVWAGGFTPNHFVDVTDTWESKLDACRCYGDEIRHWPHARSEQAIIALLMHRGAIIGVSKAEGFIVGRDIA